MYSEDDLKQLAFFWGRFFLIYTLYRFFIDITKTA